MPGDNIADGYRRGLLANLLIEARHKNFISYYHASEEIYRTLFELRYSHLFINKSVQIGDIATDNSSEYIKRLILEDFITDASVVTVLVGPDTKGRKHVDWEIAAGLNKKVGGYSGLIGILVPGFPLQPNDKYYYADIPPRLAANAKTGYADMYTWDWITADESRVKAAIEVAFRKRKDQSEKIDNSLPLFTNNR